MLHRPLTNPSSLSSFLHPPHQKNPSSISLPRVHSPLRLRFPASVGGERRRMTAVNGETRVLLFFKLLSWFQLHLPYSPFIFFYCFGSASPRWPISGELHGGGGLPQLMQHQNHTEVTLFPHIHTFLHSFSVSLREIRK